MTGASGGIGRCIALALAENGAELALVGRREEALQSLAGKCRDWGVAAKCYKIDLLNEPEIRDLKRLISVDFAGVDILIHCAGVIALSNVATASVGDFDWQYRCNVRAPFLLTQIFLPSLVDRKGQIVFINSTVGLKARAGVSQYSATKHALKALADSVREEINAEGVRVLSVYLGRTATRMQARVHEAERRHYHPEKFIQPEQVALALMNALTMGPEAEITDINIRPNVKATVPANGRTTARNCRRRSGPVLRSVDRT